MRQIRIRLGLPPIERRVAAPENPKTSAEIQAEIAAQMKAQEEAMRRKMDAMEKDLAAKTSPPASGKPPH